MGRGDIPPEKIQEYRVSGYQSFLRGEHLNPNKTHIYFNQGWLQASLKYGHLEEFKHLLLWDED